MQPIYLRQIPNYCKKEFEKNIFNKRFGHLRVLGISDKTDSTNVHFVICICDCGRIFHTRKVNVLRGRTKSCCDYVSIEEEQKRLIDKIEIDENGCWIWKGGTYKRDDGLPSYGRFESKLFPDEYLAHRLSFLLFKQSISKDMFICHMCDIENCVNPDHLFLGTHEINTLDMVLKNRQAKGEKNGSSKYDEETVLQARQLYKDGMSPKFISLNLDIPQSTIKKFIYRYSWKHI